MPYRTDRRTTFREPGDIMRNYGSKTWQELEVEWITAKAEAEAATTRLKTAEAALKTEINRRGDVPSEADERVDIDGVRVTIQYRLNEGRTTIDSARLKTEQPEIAEAYAKIGKPFQTFKVKVKTAAALADVA